MTARLLAEKIREKLGDVNSITESMGDASPMKSHPRAPQCTMFRCQHPNATHNHSLMRPRASKTSTFGLDLTFKASNLDPAPSQKDSPVAGQIEYTTALTSHCRLALDIAALATEGFG